MARYSKTEVLEAATEFEAIVLELRSHLYTRGEIYSKVDRVSRSGMARWFEFYVIIPGKNPGEAPWLRRLTRIVAILAGVSQDKNGALRMDGCGMDMGFAALDHALRATERALGREYNSLRQISPSYI